ncbi:MAG: hypothetical protein ACKOQ9_05435, partial [Verrucomicrobiota bacterium]
MSQNDDDKGGQRMSGKPVLVWLLLMLAVVALLQFAGPEPAAVQPFNVSQVLTMAQEKKIRTLSVREDPAGGKGWYQITGELNVKGAAEGEKSRFSAAGRLTDKEFEALRSSVPVEAFKDVPAQTGWTMFLWN